MDSKAETLNFPFKNPSDNIGVEVLVLHVTNPGLNQGPVYRPLSTTWSDFCAHSQG